MSIYHDKQRALQDAFDTRRLADVIESNNLHLTFNPLDEAFIAAKDFFFLATADASGKPSCSFKAGPAGFVRIVDERTLAFPCYDGNGMYLSMGNVLANPKVGMLFVDFEKPNRLRISGEASIAENDPLLAHYPEAQFIVRVAVTEIFLNCPRYIPKIQAGGGLAVRAGRRQTDAVSELEADRFRPRDLAGARPRDRHADARHRHHGLHPLDRRILKLPFTAPCRSRSWH